MVPPLYLQIITVIGIVIILAVFFHYVPFFLWLSAKVSGVRVSLVQLFLMRIRNVPPHVIVPAMIEAHKAGLNTITRDELEAHYMAGGHVEKVVHALVSASKANIELSFQMARNGARQHPPAGGRRRRRYRLGTRRRRHRIEHRLVRES